MECTAQIHCLNQYERFSNVLLQVKNNHGADTVVCYLFPRAQVKCNLKKHVLLIGAFPIFVDVLTSSR